MIGPTSLPDAISLALLLCTLPGAVWFIALYVGDGWQRHWFGRSLMAIAVGVLLACMGGIAFRIYGIGFWGREWLGVVVWSLTCFGMWTRALVLRNAQRDDPPGVRRNGRH